jgi:membrane protein
VIVTGILVAAPIALETMGLRTDLLIGARWFVLFVVAAGAFAIAYRFGPCRTHARWRWVRWGAVFAAFAWLAGSAGFSWYLNNIAHLQVTYGSLGAVIGFMLWVWFSVLLVLIGAELNAEIEHQTAIDSTVGPPKPIGRRGAVVADTVGRPFIGIRRGVGHARDALARIWGRLRGRTVSPARLPAPPGERPGPRRSAAR